MTILTEARKPSEPPMWLRDMTQDDYLAVAKERYEKEVSSGTRQPPTCKLTGEENVTRD